MFSIPFIQTRLLQAQKNLSQHRTLCPVDAMGAKAGFGAAMRNFTKKWVECCSFSAPKSPKKGLFRTSKSFRNIASALYEMLTAKITKKKAFEALLKKRVPTNKRECHLHKKNPFQTGDHKARARRCSCVRFFKSYKRRATFNWKR